MLPFLFYCRLIPVDPAWAGPDRLRPVSRIIWKGLRVGAVVGRGGRPDLTSQALDEVRVPTMLIVGRNDDRAIAHNQQAFARLKGRKAIKVIPGAGHLFSEPGAMAIVVDPTADWFGWPLLATQSGEMEQADAGDLR